MVDVTSTSTSELLDSRRKNTIDDALKAIGATKVDDSEG
jgi:hypothetical protein